MSAAMARPALSPFSDDIGACPRLWTRAEYYRAAEAGIFRAEERLELIAGEVIAKMSPQGTPHATAIRATTEALESAFGEGYDVRPQLPLTIPGAEEGERDSEPEPDVLVVIGSWRDYRDRHPGPADARLVVEVSDTTLWFDQNRKAALYARAGIAEYWVLNLPERFVAVYRDPTPEGFLSQTRHTEQESIAPLSAPNASIAVSDVLP